MLLTSAGRAEVAQPIDHEAAVYELAMNELRESGDVDPGLVDWMSALVAGGSTTPANPDALAIANGEEPADAPGVTLSQEELDHYLTLAQTAIDRSSEVASSWELQQNKYEAAVDHESKAAILAGFVSEHEAELLSAKLAFDNAQAYYDERAQP